MQKENFDIHHSVRIPASLSEYQGVWVDTRGDQTLV